MPHPRMGVTGAPLSLDALTLSVSGAAGGPIGAIASFVGVVRDENAGRAVTFLEYEAYEPLALKAFARVEAESLAAWPGVTLGIWHRTGRLEIGEASIAIVAASAHRAEALAACRYAIERVKQIAPVWKHEHFTGGEVWIEGATADPDDFDAREEARRRACV